MSLSMCMSSTASTSTLTVTVTVPNCIAVFVTDTAAVNLHMCFPEFGDCSYIYAVMTFPVTMSVTGTAAEAQVCLAVCGGQAPIYFTTIPVNVIAAVTITTVTPTATAAVTGGMCLAVCGDRLPLLLP